MNEGVASRSDDGVVDNVECRMGLRYGLKPYSATGGNARRGGPVCPPAERELPYKNRAVVE